MDLRRLFLYVALGLVLVWLWTAWQRSHVHVTPVSKVASVSQVRGTAQQRSSQGASETTESRIVEPQTYDQSAALFHSSMVKLGPEPGQTETISNSLVSLSVNLQNGDVTEATLKKYPEKEGTKTPYSLITTSHAKRFLVLRPLLAMRALNGNGWTALREPKAPLVRKKPGQLTLSWVVGPFSIDREYILSKGSYVIRLLTRIKNKSDVSREVVSATSLVGRKPAGPPHIWDHMFPKYWSYRGPSYFAEGSYNKISADSLKRKPLAQSVQGGWIGAVNQYFDVALIPAKNHTMHFFGNAVGSNGYTVGFSTPKATVTAGNEKVFSTRIFVGPKLQGQLNQIAKGLERTVDYGKATIISAPLFWILSRIHGLVGNWGWSIIILVLLIKTLFYWPQRFSARSMAKMRKLHPRIKHLQERYKDDRQKLSQATMELYRKEGASPVAGCLPMIIQLPVFFGLFYVLIYSVELRMAPWVLWIRDLAAPDPYYILPILYAIIMLVQFRLQPQTGDKNQTRMLMLMPLPMAFLYAVFPSGLVLYYLFSTLLNVLIQWQVNREVGVPMPNFNPFKKS